MVYRSIGMKIIFILILYLSIHGSKGRKRYNSTSIKRDDNNNDSSFSMSPSVSYQYHTNDHSDFVDLKGSDEGSTFNNSHNTISSSQQNYQNDFAEADSSAGYVQSPISPNQQLVYSQPRDSYMRPPEMSAYPMDNYGTSINDMYAPAVEYGYVSNPGPSEGYYDSSQAPPSDGYNYAPNPVPSETYGYPPSPSPSYGYVQSKGYGYGHGAFGHGGGGEGGIDGGHGEPAPPPPPPTIKGSIDYVLIPLILIGIAGPIFVVLYVVLGAYEARLAPFTAGRSSQTWSDTLADSFQMLQPATELMFNSIENGLGNFECIDQAICHLGSYGHDLGLERLGYLQSFVEVFGLRGKYKRQLETLFSTLRRKPKSCFSIQCPNNNNNNTTSSTTTILKDSSNSNKKKKI